MGFLEDEGMDKRRLHLTEWPIESMYIIRKVGKGASKLEQCFGVKFDNIFLITMAISSDPL